MEWSLIVEYAWVLGVLIVIEGLLSADNALVMAVFAKHLPAEQQKKAIRYGLWFAFGFRVAAIFAISFVATIWQVQAIGAAYLLFLSVKHFVSRKQHEEKEKNGAAFSTVVMKIAFADLVFAIDSILAAVALVIALPDTSLGMIGGMDAAKFILVVLGGLAGLLLIKVASQWFITLLATRPGLESAAFIIVGWVGVKLAVITLSHPSVSWIDPHFPESATWKICFWSVMILIVLIGYFGKKPSNSPT